VLGRDDPPPLDPPSRQPTTLLSPTSHSRHSYSYQRERRVLEWWATVVALPLVSPFGIVPPFCFIGRATYGCATPLAWVRCALSVEIRESSEEREREPKMREKRGCENDDRNPSVVSIYVWSCWAYWAFRPSLLRDRRWSS
jgi:hypothetical protein